MEGQREGNGGGEGLGESRAWFACRAVRKQAGHRGMLSAAAARPAPLGAARVPFSFPGGAERCSGSKTPCTTLSAAAWRGGFWRAEPLSQHIKSSLRKHFLSQISPVFSQRNCSGVPPISQFRQIRILSVFR